MLFLLLAGLLTAPLWWRPRAARRWPWVPVVLAVAVLASALASTRLPAVRDRFSQLLLLEGVQGNDRWDLWRATWQSWLRAPVVGTGLGGYRHVIGLDKPATGEYVLEEAHNDWLEWQSTGGVLGMAALGLAVLGCVGLLLPGRVRRLRFEYRYPLAGAAVALVATATHEIVGFGLQIPLNRYLLALWVGVLWGVWGATSAGEREEGTVP